MMLALSPILIGLSMFLLMAVCVLLILTILIQRPQGGGLSGAFGSGAGSGQTAFGTKTGDALTIFTIIMFVAFVLTSILLVFVTRPSDIAIVPPTAEQTPAQPGQVPVDQTPVDQAPTDPGATVPPASGPTPPATDPSTAPATEPTTAPGATPPGQPASTPPAPAAVPPASTPPTAPPPGESSPK